MPLAVNSSGLSAPPALHRVSPVPVRSLALSLMLPTSIVPSSSAPAPPFGISVL